MLTKHSYEQLTNKSDGYLSIERYCTEQNIDSTSLMPQTCVFRRIPQSGSELRKKRRQAMFSNELNRLIELFDKEKKKSSRNVWIVKPDEGHCGEDIELCLDINQVLGKEIWYCDKFKGIHEAESTRKITPNQQKNILDKRRLKRRYKLFLNDLKIQELLKLYNFDKEILFFIFKSKIKSYRGRLQTDFWATLVINIIKIKFKIFLKTLK